MSGGYRRGTDVMRRAHSSTRHHIEEGMDIRMRKIHNYVDVEASSIISQGKGEIPPHIRVISGCGARNNFRWLGLIPYESSEQLVYLERPIFLAHHSGFTKQPCMQMTPYMTNTMVYRRNPPYRVTILYNSARYGTSRRPNRK